MTQGKIEIPMTDIELLFGEAVLSIAQVGQAILTDVQSLQKTQMELLLKYTKMINDSLTAAIENSSKVPDISETLKQDPEMIKFSSDYDKSTTQLSHCNQFLETLKTEFSQFQKGSSGERVAASMHLLPKLTFLKTKVSKDDFNKPLDFKALNSNP
ncbi:hypothetical protein DIZ81_06575 [Legionella taurinensis]|uniref:Phasin family protein n=1 Tax=Legionella taurinensis TaxID=70611 RepID=A0AB38N6P8_9GAMM|nr:hypothetical protein [Legionella taurinensis]MDX1837265.1 hypothetical protein [Legionella taurinensis]PUT40263.1 hypothetical protein DB744_06575 [Legionella taurinensis]PUT41497.1 hypothetical protein DB746_09085 [Legionella taurinensis]PUT44363.1 hypothetical protein DB743_08300 [Legionella taurinensis]PUT48325.1 hypothetical protein DB745_04975 [Legionella taurinensis]